MLQPLILIALMLPSPGMASARPSAVHAGQAPAPAAKRQGHTVAPRTAQRVREANVRAHMTFLAGDALQGRGSATAFEQVAAQYIASQLAQFGIAPAGDAGEYLQTIGATERAFAEPPHLRIAAGASPTEWTHGKEILVLWTSDAGFGGPLQRLMAGAQPAPGAVVLLRFPEQMSEQERGAHIFSTLMKGARAVLVPETASLRAQWSALGTKPPELALAREGATTSFVEGAVVALSSDAATTIEQVAESTRIEMASTVSQPKRRQTWNVVGKLAGSDPRRSPEVVVLSAHMDHLGVGPEVAGDSVYNGADDDASGVTAVLEIARALGAGRRPKRTVFFVFFGSEESGGLGSQHFIEYPPVPLERIVANLQFEMIGRPDPKIPADTLWLTGSERSNLWAHLRRRGARLVADPRPEQNFFQRSDNYVLARRGVVAHAASSFGLHADYHQPSDELSQIDFAHMTRVIQSLVVPLRWLANSSFRPAWTSAGRP